MRCLFLLAGLAATGFAVASFDLVLVADNTGDVTGPVTTKIHRYDGGSGTYLGNFGLGTGLIRDMAVNQAANELYTVNDVNRLYVVDYNTGDIKREFAITGTSVKFHNGVLYRSNGSTLSTVNLLTGATTTVINWSQTITDFAFANNGSLVLFNGTTSNLQGYSSGLVAGGLVTTIGFSANSVRISPDFGAGNNLTLMGLSPSTATASTTVFTTYSVNNAGTPTGVSSGNYFTSFTNNFVDLAPAHYGYWMLGKNGTGANMLYHFGTSLGAPQNFVATPQVTTAGPIAVVLAPEPGTMIALGAGIAALLRRKRKSQ